jgi:hypothetical protein
MLGGVFWRNATVFKHARWANGIITSKLIFNNKVHQVHISMLSKSSFWTKEKQPLKPEYEKFLKRKRKELLEQRYEIENRMKLFKKEKSTLSRVISERDQKAFQHMLDLRKGMDQFKRIKAPKIIKYASESELENEK